MKKFFLPLLAVVGMAVGLTLSSCGGGGGSKGSDITGLDVSTGAGIPSFNMTVTERLGQSNVYRTRYSFGVGQWDGSFAVASGYPIKDEGEVIVKGKVGVDDVKVLQDSSFIAWLGGKPDALSVQLDSLIELTITVKDRKSNSGTLVAECVGVFFVKDDASMKLPDSKNYDSVYINGASRLFQSLDEMEEEEGE